MKIALGADHGGYLLKEEIKEYLRESGYEVSDYGTDSCESVDYPSFGAAVGQALMEKKADLGIVICGTGIGISLAANKVKGIRAALCVNSYMARMAREHNNANVLALGARVIGAGLALDIVDTFVKASFAGGRHAKRVEMLSALENI
ncbi:ribose-5-phosphate isomerase [Syntrophobotulus glycolicus DSM 8271]|uniref:Ribose-5-phosphate isomerase n=1 Tax=Syntrophobotulus glycolicus (strain DSM 8271 / FlGlyR) TaxID=645991 RepID=F0T2B9_SYNGF|nr:ribose 5-phosphate isomerase B [Syntrophobotulus glycolicus]ADY57547.1 ribose-5-phosphate isomerase [Syntrophobotulus glycolicus DSM 8271]